MKEDSYNKDYRAKDYETSTKLETETNKRKPTLLAKILVGLFVLLVCSLGYDNIVEPHLEKKGQQTESPITSSTQDNEDTAIDETDDITSIVDDEPALEIIEEPIQRSQPVTTKQAERKTPTAPANPAIEPTTKPTESSRTVQPEQSRRNTASTQPMVEDESELSTLEIMERRNHANVMKQAQRAGVSTEGSTLDIMERINHANVVKQAQRAGVSTEGTTLEIMERINHANVVKQAQRAGVSTEGTTLEIMERINHANVVKQAQRAGVSTEGSTLDIMERINRKNMQRMGY